MGACCCRRRISVETQTAFVGRVHDCPQLDALNEDHCHDIDDVRIPRNLNPKTLTAMDSDENCVIVNASASNSPINSDAIERDFLQEHNYYRQMHGCPPLTLNHSLCILAKEWAQHLVLKNTINNRSDPKFGENIYMSTNEKLKPNEIVKIWYDEIQYYKFKEQILSPNTVHFTQIIWRNTKELGIGIDRIDNTLCVVAFYSPPGNCLKKFSENVPQLTSESNKTK